MHAYFLRNLSSGCLFQRVNVALLEHLNWKFADDCVPFHLNLVLVIAFLYVDAIPGDSSFLSCKYVKGQDSVRLRDKVAGHLILLTDRLHGSNG